MSSDAEARTGRWGALDGLRGVAVALVVLYHFRIPGPTLRRLEGGWGGVDVFFVLSGFLITTLLMAERERTGRIDFRAFYRRRWRRLGPPLLAVLAVGELATWLWAWPGSSYGAGRRIADLQSLLLIRLNWSWIGPGHPPGPLFANLWSLSVEEQFYLLWPVVLLAVSRAASPGAARRRLGMVAAAGAFASAAECLLLYRGPDSQVRIYFGTDTRAQGLLIGAAAAILLASGRRLTSPWSAGLAGIGAAVVAVIAWSVRDDSPFRVTGAFTLLALATAAVILHVLWQPGSVLARALAVEPLRWLGLRSYALYLWHGPIATFLYRSTRPGTTRWGWPGYFGGIALSLVLAELSWRLIERRRPGRPTRPDGPRLRRGQRSARFGHPPRSEQGPGRQRVVCTKDTYREP